MSSWSTGQRHFWYKRAYVDGPLFNLVCSIINSRFVARYNEHSFLSLIALCYNLLRRYVKSLFYICNMITLTFVFRRSIIVLDLLAFSFALIFYFFGSAPNNCVGFTYFFLPSYSWEFYAFLWARAFDDQLLEFCSHKYNFGCCMMEKFHFCIWWSMLDMNASWMSC